MCRILAADNIRVTTSGTGSSPVGVLGDDPAADDPVSRGPD